MMGLIKKIKKNLRSLNYLRKMGCLIFPDKNELGLLGKNSFIEYPVYIQTPGMVFVESDATVRRDFTVLNNTNEKIVIGKYSVISVRCTIITNSHTSVVGVPQNILGVSHIGDKTGDVIVEEDVWVGAGVTIMPGVVLGRGCIVGAGSIVTKSVPPYAVVKGLPARIYAVRFDYVDIIKHEETIYDTSNRIQPNRLRALFNTHFLDKKIFSSHNNLTEEELAIINSLKQ